MNFRLVSLAVAGALALRRNSGVSRKNSDPASAGPLGEGEGLAAVLC